VRMVYRTVKKVVMKITGRTPPSSPPSPLGQKEPAPGFSGD